MKNKTQILVAEDELELQEKLVQTVELENYDITITNNGLEAFEKTNSKQFDVYVIDLMMPVMDGEQFIKKLKIKIPDAVIIVATGIVEPDTIINIMNLGIYDYVIKPYKPEKFLKILKNAAQYKESLDLTKKIELEKDRQKQTDLLWEKYKEKLNNKSKFDLSRSLVSNLQATLAQGAGFGLTISLTDFIQVAKVEDSNTTSYLIDKEVIDMLIHNNSTCKNQIFSLTNSLSILSKNSLDLEKISVGEVFHSFQTLIETFNAISTERKNTSIHSKFLDKAYYSKINKSFLLIAFEELLVNALKFSLKNSKIHVTTFIKDGFLFIVIKNNVDSKYSEVNGVTLIEPFLTLHPPVEDFNDIEKYGMGLGLTIVEHITSLHHGIFQIHGVMDHTQQHSPVKGIISEIGLPIE